MSYYTVYDPANGEIKFNLIGTMLEIDVPAGMEVADGMFDAKKYVYDIAQQTFVERPVLDLQYSTDPVTVDTWFLVENIPAGSTLNYPGGSIVIDDGFFEWTTDIPGIYSFEVSAPAYLPVTITATFID